MVCTCRRMPRCLVCNTPIRVPLSELEASTGASVLIDRFARRDSSEGRESLRRMIQGSTTCPTCGNTIHHTHERICVGTALAAMGVPMHEREVILGKISFPEG
jgi:hypothetical protein